MKNGKIYSLYHRKDFYIGSTFQPISHRLGGHRHECKRSPNILLYRKMNEIGINNFEYMILNNIKCENTNELRELEKFYIKLLKPNLNTKSPIQTEEEKKIFKYQYNKSDKMQEYRRSEKMQEYYKNYRNSEEGKKYHKEYTDKYYSNEENREHKNKQNRERYYANKEEISKKRKERRIEKNNIVSN